MDVELNLMLKNIIDRLTLISENLSVISDEVNRQREEQRSTIRKAQDSDVNKLF